MSITDIIINFSGLVTYADGSKSSLHGSYNENNDLISETSYENEGYKTTHQITDSDLAVGSEPKFPLESFPWHNRLIQLFNDLSTHISGFAETPSVVITQKNINDMILRLNVICSYTPDSDWTENQLVFSATYQDGVLTIHHIAEAELFGAQLAASPALTTIFGQTLDKAMQQVSFTVA